jgi:hypothetical protein
MQNVKQHAMWRVFNLRLTYRDLMHADVRLQIAREWKQGTGI